MQDIVRERSRLLAEHTAPQPTLQRSAAEAALAAEELISTHAESAQAVLIYALTPVGLLDAVDHTERPQALRRALAVLGAIPTDSRAAALEQLTFNLTHPTSLELIWPILVSSFTADRLLERVLESVRSGNQLHIFNALHIPWYTVGRSSTYWPRKELAEELTREVERLRGMQGLNGLVAKLLERWFYPRQLAGPGQSGQIP